MFTTITSKILSLVCLIPIAGQVAIQGAASCQADNGLLLMTTTSKSLPGGSERLQTQSSFEVASVRLSPANSNEAPGISPAGSSRFKASHVSLKLLVGIAYGIPQNHILNGPSWFESQFYDIEAKSVDDHVLDAKERQLCLRQLLKDRFNLTLHHLVGEVAGYNLVVAGSEPKLHQSVDVGQGYILQGRIFFPGTSIEDFARILERIVGQPVSDKTGIEGRYSIKLEYAALDDVDSTLPSIFTVLQNQLGLKLIPHKVEVDQLVIDQVNREPSGN